MKFKLLAITAVLLTAAVVNQAHGQAILFQENFDDPDVGTLVLSNVTLTEIVDPTDAGNTVGEIVIDGTSDFVNINTNGAVPEALPAGALDVNLSADILVPSGGAGTAADFAFLQLNFFDAGGVNVGTNNSTFPTLDTASATLDTFATITTGDIAVPTDAISFTGLLISGAFSNDNAAGTIYLVDNFVVSANVAAVPEPTSLAVLLLGGVFAMARRRR